MVTLKLLNILVHKVYCQQRSVRYNMFKDIFWQLLKKVKAVENENVPPGISLSDFPIEKKSRKKTNSLYLEMLFSAVEKYKEYIYFFRFIFLSFVFFLYFWVLMTIQKKLYQCTKIEFDKKSTVVINSVLNAYMFQKLVIFRKKSDN